MSAPHLLNGRIRELPHFRDNDFCPTLAIAEPQWERSENAASKVTIHRAKGAIALTGQRTLKELLFKRAFR